MGIGGLVAVLCVVALEQVQGGPREHDHEQSRDRHVQRREKEGQPAANREKDESGPEARPRDPHVSRVPVDGARTAEGDGTPEERDGDPLQRDHIWSYANDGKRVLSRSDGRGAQQIGPKQRRTRVLPYESHAFFPAPVQLSGMIGAYTIGKKAVTFGYKRYGIPGAVATGGAALAGYLVVRRALKRSANADTTGVESAIDAGEVKSAVEQKGLGAVTEPETLERAIDQEEVGSALDMDDVQSSAESEADAMADESGGDEPSDGN